MLAQLDDISAFPFKCSHKVFVIVIRDVIDWLIDWFYLGIKMYMYNTR